MLRDALVHYISDQCLTYISQFLYYILIGSIKKSGYYPHWRKSFKVTILFGVDLKNFFFMWTKD